MTFHYIEFKAFCQATEDPEKVIQAMVNIAGECIHLEKEDAEGYYGNPIEIIQGKISRNNEIDQVFLKLPPSILKTFLKTLDKRIDDRCNFYFRLDKQKAYEKEFMLADGSNTIKCRARVESYPADKKKAVNRMENYLKEISD
ncbi:MAG: RNA-binding domain-containing protein [Thermoplasmatota archaeon]